MDIPESYASPGQRLGLFKVDHPKAPPPEFELISGSDPRVPPQEFSGEGSFCLCTLAYHPSEGMDPVYGYKETADAKKNDSAGWRVLCVKAMGRALKDAGYPADLHELNDVQNWRAKNARVAAILAGVPNPPAEVSPGQTPRETPVDIEPEDHVDADEAVDSTESREAPETSVDSHLALVPEKIEQPPLEAAANDDQVSESGSTTVDRDAIRAELNSLTEEEKIAFRTFMGEAGITGKADTWTNEQLVNIEHWLTS